MPVIVILEKMNRCACVHRKHGVQGRDESRGRRGVRRGRELKQDGEWREGEKRRETPQYKIITDKCFFFRKEETTVT